MRDWSREVEHAFSQVTDWSWAKNDSQNNSIYRNIFGIDRFSKTYLVVCGRNAFLNPTEQSRPHWRSETTTIASCPIRFWTYDDLYEQTFDVFEIFRAAGGHRAV
jgi:hypothetical protein